MTTTQKLGIVLQKAIQEIHQFRNQHNQIPQTPYLIPQLIVALLQHSLNPIVLGEDLWNHTNHRTSGASWLQFLAGHDVQTDDGTGHKYIAIDNAGIEAITALINDSPPVQYRLYCTRGRIPGMFPYSSHSAISPHSPPEKPPPPPPHQPAPQSATRRWPETSVPETGRCVW